MLSIFLAVYSIFFKTLVAKEFIFGLLQITC